MDGLPLYEQRATDAAERERLARQADAWAAEAERHAWANRPKPVPADHALTREEVTALAATIDMVLVDNEAAAFGAHLSAASLSPEEAPEAIGQLAALVAEQALAITNLKTLLTSLLRLRGEAEPLPGKEIT